MNAFMSDVADMGMAIGWFVSLLLSGCCRLQNSFDHRLQSQPAGMQ